MNPVSLYTLLLIALLFKHLVADLPLQRGWMALNKGIYGHPGGLCHAAVHGAASITVLLLFSPYFSYHLILLIVALEVIVHYHIDFFKMNWENKAGYSYLTYENDDPKGKAKTRVITNNYYYWYLVGDQALHFLTYVVMGWALLTYS